MTTLIASIVMITLSGMIVMIAMIVMLPLHYHKKIDNDLEEMERIINE